ncbi:Signal peptidase complex subunit-like protein [Hapsidospora chrysogenum ATCC 11550]|uniref:Signal peptidase subunit 3 n=1 Tax=Hapsidospora chrysogenum (strain ATCC 11550 / CBS 779.69 / DSM 880 / IAM 14645 / JCM 23072 / IMI 49137) TaxID=857340 RepID=A0A086TE26_HAPC1|nr:Signal peptidase complex subunit-like protein [Hapsidospora chrysogenum ATCC 11550]
MHNTLNRLQSVFGFFTTVAGVLACFIAATDLYTARSPSGVIKPTNTQVVKGRPHYYSTKKEEYAIIKFSLDADLSSLFTWNTKQVFVYVTAEWPEPGTNATNEAVIWDSIITSPSADHLSNIGPHSMKKLKESAKGRSIVPERGILFLKSQKPKYQITHPSGKIANAEDVTLKVHYSVQPWVGLMSWDTESDYGFWSAFSGGVSDKFSLPAVKTKDEKPKKSRDTH